jgi:hypothetical protein
MCAHGIYHSKLMSEAHLEHIACGYQGYHYISLASVQQLIIQSLHIGSTALRGPWPSSEASVS